MRTETFEVVEEWLRGAVDWLELVVEGLGALVIALGVLLAVWEFARDIPRGSRADHQRVRLTLAHYLALALEFLLAADVLATAISPSWDQIGKLAAIAAIRTLLNFFLMQEMKHEGATTHREWSDEGDPG
jgi:uncharacterized membrane protein